MRAVVAFGAVFILAACAGGSPTGTTADGSIRGTVTDNTGATVANAALALSGNGQAARTTNSASDGVYTFASVAPGTYTLTVTPPAGFTVGGASTSSITVAGDEEANASAFVLNRVIVNGSVSGTIIDDEGGTVGNAAVQLSGNAQATRSTNSNINGGYTFTNVAPGAYSLAVTPPPGFTAGAQGSVDVTVAEGAQTSAGAIVLHRMSPDSFFAAVLHAHLVNVTASDEFSGAVLVVRDGDTLFAGAYGLADRAQGIANTVDTRFRVGSMNKMLTAVAVLQLVQAGEIDLDASLLTYLPDYPNVELATKVTIHHLLTHTGGTGDIFGPTFMEHRLELREPDDYLELYGTRDLLFEPGGPWTYSNYGFVLLGAVIERVTGMRYDDYVAANIHAPAGMTATGAAPEDSVVPGRAVGYMSQNGVLVSNAPTLPYRGTPAGGGYSTVGDFERFAAAVLEHRLLDAEHTALLLDGKVDMGPNPMEYAYGFTDRMQVGMRLAGHPGGAAGMNGTLSFERDGGYTVVVLSNLSPPAAGQVESFILGALPN